MKIKLSLLCFVALFMAATTFAENYPYRNDFLWVAEPDHADWIYALGEEATLHVQLYRYGMPVDGVTVCYEVGGDMMAADTRGEVVLQQGKATILLGTASEPCFRDCRLRATMDGVTTEHHVKVGFSPQLLTPYTVLPADFEAFWQQAKAEAEAFPLCYKQTPCARYSTETVECSLVQIDLNKQGQTIYGYLFCPKNATSCPVVLCPPGAGIKTIKDPMRHIYYAEQGCIRLEIEIHGLHPDTPEATFREVTAAFGGRSNGYLLNGLDSRDNYYMKHVYLACVRAIDLLTSLPAWDGKNVIVQGASQGGALALVTAALDSRVTACVANHPALSDMAGYKAGRAGGYPHLFTKSTDQDKPDKIATLAYYDVANFARFITVPTHMSWGFNDNTCPPTTSYIVYNLLACDKEPLITPITEHWVSDTTERIQFAWILHQIQLRNAKK